MICMVWCKSVRIMNKLSTYRKFDEMQIKNFEISIDISHKVIYNRRRIWQGVLEVPKFCRMILLNVLKNFKRRTS